MPYKTSSFMIKNYKYHLIKNRPPKNVDAIIKDNGGGRSKRAPLYLFILYIVLAAQTTVAATPAMLFQDRITVKGIVRDELGQPMIGVTVIEDGTSNGTQTDFDGNFTLSVNEDSKLKFTFVGYKPQLYSDFSADTPVEIGMELDVASLEEVVIVGYGEQKKESVVAAISQVDGEEVLKTGATTNVSESLQGLAPGVTVVNSDGLPGKGANGIQIRGVGTWANTDPLIIVDGIERGFNQIDPSEIETISILKDASATAVYGVRGANGVILITTKRGRTGDPTFNFSSNFGFKFPTRNKQNTDWVTTMQMYNEAAANDRLWENQIPQSEIQAWIDNAGQAGPYNPYFPQIDWWDEVVRDFGFQQQYNLNVSGGTETMKYFGSLGYVKDGDIFNTTLNESSDFDPDFGFERYNWRFNLDFDITKTTQFSINFAGNFRNRLQPFFGPSDASIYSKVHTLPTNSFPIKYPDGEWGDSAAGGQNFIVLLNEGGQEIHKSYQGFYDAKLNQKLDFVTKGLSAEAKIAFTSNSSYFSALRRDRSTFGNASLGAEVRYYRDYDITNPIYNEDGTVDYPLLSEIRWPTSEYQGGKPIVTNYDQFQNYGRRLFYQFSTNYKRTFGKHAVTGLALMNRQTNVDANSSAVFDFPSYREDWVGRVTYAYDSKYLLELNGAYTGSEKFARGKRFGFFPSFAVGWVLTNEDFFNKLTGDAIDFFKVRYSQGEMGSDLGAPRFAYVQTYSSGGNVPFGYDNRTNYGPLYQEGKAASPDASWETALKRNLGFELKLFNKRLNANLDLYTENRMGILMDYQTIPAWFGANEPSANIGEAKNRGYELALTWRDQIGKNFNYRIGGDISQFENRIVFQDDPRMQDDYLKSAGKPIRWTNQGPRVINSGYYQSLDDIYNYAPPGLGISVNNLVPGDLLFVDYNADGVVDVQDQVVMKQQLYPRMIYGFNMGFDYKNFSFQARFYGVSDIGRNKGDRLTWDFLDGEIMAQNDVLTRWTPETAGTAQKPSLHIGSNILHNNSISTYNYTDGDYLRLKSVEMSYTFKNGLEKFGMNKLQIYGNANNLITWSKNSWGTDPEAFAGNTYPIVKRYNVGLRLTF